MDVRLIAKILWARRRLLRHDRWTREQLIAHQERSLRDLRAYAASCSSFYGRFHRGLADRPLHELPVLTKTMLMEGFDRLVTDPHVRLHEVEAHLATLQGAERFLGRYFVNATSGSTGRRGIFLFNLDEWVTVLASYARAYAWAGVEPGLRRSVKTAVVSTTTPWHQSAMVGASVQSPFVPTLRLNATEPLERLVEELNAFGPEALIAYASMGRRLASAQLEGTLHIRPRAVLSASEVLTPEARRLIQHAWGQEPYDVYGATETATLAAECEFRRSHLFEDLVLTEVVDEDHRPVPEGAEGAKVLVTVLFSRTLPLIRYEMSDSLRLAPGTCPCGRPYALLGGIQGRSEEVLELPTATGEVVKLHPNVFHNVMDLFPVGGWQMVQRPGELEVLVVGRREAALEGRITSALQHALTVRGVTIPSITVLWVDAIPRSAVGKAPLIKAYRAPA